MRSTQTLARYLILSFSLLYHYMWTTRTPARYNIWEEDIITSSLPLYNNINSKSLQILNLLPFHRLYQYMGPTRTLARYCSREENTHFCLFTSTCERRGRLQGTAFVIQTSFLPLYHLIVSTGTPARYAFVKKTSFLLLYQSMGLTRTPARYCICHSNIS
jgi:hypothetical protein